MIGFQQFKPSELLRNIADEVWAFHPAHQTGTLASYPPLRVLPDGCTDLIVRLSITGQGDLVPMDAVICGPTDRHKLTDRLPRTAYVGVRFKLGTAGLALGIHPPDLLGQEVDARICSPKMTAFLDALYGYSTVSAVADAICGFLGQALATTTRMPSALRVQKAIELMQSERGTSRIADLASSVGVSERTLYRDILDATGLPPKLLARILRFQTTADRMTKCLGEGLCELAIDCGYADQAHMTREFSELGGITPAAMIVGRATGEEIV